MPGSDAYVEDSGDSNWIYNSAYAEFGGSTGHFRGALRTGNQAMHGLHNYNAQLTTATFAAEKYYTYTVWAQGDADAVAVDDRAFLYLFNGGIPFSEAGSLTFKGFQGGPGGDFANRGPTMTAVQSQANWTKLTITHVTYPGDPEIGQPVGVGFYINRDAAIDDAALDVDDAANHLMVLEVNTTNGQVRVRNQTTGAVKIDYYDIKSNGGALNTIGWNSLQQQNLAGFPAGNGSGNGWEKAGGSGATAIGESYLTGNSDVATGANIGLGGAFNVAGAHDLVFEYGAIVGSNVNPTGDYNNNGVVDAADYVLWRNSLNLNITLPNDSTPGTVTQADYDVWRTHFGQTSSLPPSTLMRGLVHYVTSFSGTGLGSDNAVPEPSGILLVGIGFTALAVRRKRTNSG